ncbi:MAG TPA: Uma2 family endonuclease [Polyangia bacterium]|jgi:Uma2 family endonuclease|nr:Uma2 family endonuclease [Polyangia bacterium]
MAPVRKRPHSGAPDRPATWDDLLQRPEDTIREIVDGKLIVLPCPDRSHTQVASDLGILLGARFRFDNGRPGGWILLDKPCLRLGAEIRVPDLAGWRRERYVNLPRRGPIPVVPDWICEVLSPATEREDRTHKRVLYLREGVGHLWLIHPDLRTLEVHRRTEAGWLLAGMDAEERVAAEPFEAMELDLGLLFGPEEAPEEEQDAKGQ